MNVNYRRLCLVACLLILVTLIKTTPAAGQIPMADPFLQAILSPAPEVRKKAVEQVLNERAILIEKLSTIIADPMNHSRQYQAVHRAIMLLGKLRANEAVGVLVDNIGFPDVMPPDAEGHPGLIVGSAKLKPVEERLPAIAALIEIGEPCADKVIEKMLQTRNLVEYEASVAVLKQLRKQSIHARLDRAITNAPPELRLRLQRSFQPVEAKPSERK